MLTIDYEHLGVREGELVLDLGCGKGRHSYEVQRLGARPVGVDLDLPALREVAEMMWAVASEEDVALGSCCMGNALQLPFASGTFDRVIVSEVLEHISEDSAAISEIVRVTKPGGTVAISVPRFWPEAVCWTLSKQYHSNQGGHVRIYRSSQLLDRLKRFGLEPYRSHHAHALHTPYWWLRCAIDLDGRAAPVARYHDFLVWDIEKQNRVVRTLERALDPVLGKSFVVYLRKVGDRVAR